MLLIINPVVFASDSPLSASNMEILIPSLPDLPQEDDFFCGDVNEDGFVNVLDIITMVNYIMGGNPSPFNMNAADINADNGINVLDVIAIVNIIMQVPGLPCGCLAPVTYDGYTYPTVQIGSQCWLRENLKAGTMINVNTGGHLQTNNGIIEKYCYDNNPANCDTYGGLYEWNEAMQYVTDDGAQGICPPGWHIPGDNEWKILEGTVDSQYPVGDPEWDRTGVRGSDAGSNLKTTAGWQDGGNGTNLSGFSGMPAGHRYDNGFYELGSWGQFWTSTPVQYYVSWHRYLTYYFDGVFRTEYVGGDNGFSVRCIRGCWPEPTQANAGPDQLNVPGTIATMAANTPTYGSGVWSIVSGTGGTFVDPWSPSAEFQGMAGNEYLLSWTITTDCGSTADTVVIRFFTCGDELVDNRDGQGYTTAMIGTQCWMTKNLNVGGVTPGIFDQYDDGYIAKYCYDDNEDNCDIYGGLYQWNEAMDYMTGEGAQGICPQGWHVPTDGEFTALSNFLGGHDQAGGKMKSTGTIEEGTGLWRTPNTGATNESGFASLPAGCRWSNNGSFIDKERYAYYWSSTFYDIENSFDRYLTYFSAKVLSNGTSKGNGFSVRCLQDL